MKKYITKILLFFAIIAIVDVCVSFVGNHLQTHAKGGDTKTLNDLVNKDRHDVLILGSSRAHHHYDTPFLSDTLGLDVYNAGYDGNGVILAYGILSMTLERYKPQLVVFDVEPSFDINVYAPDNNDTRYLKFLKPYYKKADIEQVFRDVSNEEWYKVHSGLIRYNTDIISKLMDNVKGASSFSKGYAPLVGAMAEDRDIVTNTNNLMDSLKLRYIEKIIDLAQSHKLPIVFVGSPKYGESNSMVLKPVIDICYKKKVPFLDYYSEQGIVTHKEWFKEPMHLNEQGAREFSRRFSNDIRPLLSCE